MLEHCATFQVILLWLMVAQRQLKAQAFVTARSCRRPHINRRITQVRVSARFTFWLLPSEWLLDAQLLILVLFFVERPVILIQSLGSEPHATRNTRNRDNRVAMEMRFRSSFSRLVIPRQIDESRRRLQALSSNSLLRVYWRTEQELISFLFKGPYPQGLMV